VIFPIVVIYKQVWIFWLPELIYLTSSIWVNRTFPLIILVFQCVFNIWKAKACTSFLIRKIWANTGVPCFLILKVNLLFISAWCNRVLSVHAKRSLPLEWNSTGHTVSSIGRLIESALCTSNAWIVIGRYYTCMSSYPFSPFLVFECYSNYAFVFWVLQLILSVWTLPCHSLVMWRCWGHTGRSWVWLAYNAWPSSVISKV